MKWMSVLVACVVLAGMASLRAADFVKIIHPGAASGGGTYLSAIEGDYIVGSYQAPNDGGYVMRGFFYQISTGAFQDLLPPSSLQSYGEGISGTTIVGSYDVGILGQSEGFAYNLLTGGYTTIANPYGPGGGEFGITSVSGSLYYGFYYSSITDQIVPFSTDGTSFAPVSYLSSSAMVLGAYGSATAGTNYLGPRGNPFLRTSGFFYNGSSLMTLNFPGAIDSTANGTNGILAVGSYNADGQHNIGFIYDGSTYTDYFAPDAANTELIGVTTDGFMIGNASTADGISYGFLTATVPEPGTYALLGIGAVFGLACLVARSLRLTECR